MNEIKMLPIGMLAHHPENPRKDLGNLNELAASIKANGIMQNLTVVLQPGHSMTAQEWTEICEQYGQKPTDELRDMMNQKRIPDRYLVVIGNRRLEAAKMAGLAELPCVVADMSHEEQIATMLQENMQRVDLTLWEQAEGIQMMMDLGFTKEQVQERTGFSRQTIERRLKVAGLPGKETQLAVRHGFDLTDLVEISKIEDPKAQKELLKITEDTQRNGLDSRQLRRNIRAALDKQEKEKNVKRLRPELETFAKEMKEANQRWSNSFERLHSLTIKLGPDARVIPPPPEHGSLYYYVGWTEIEIYERKPQKKAEKTPEQIALEQRKQEAKDLNARMRQLWMDWVAGFTPTKQETDRIRAAALGHWIFGGASRYTLGDFRRTYHSWTVGEFRRLAGMPQEQDRKQEESLMEEIMRRKIPMGRAILAWALSGGILYPGNRGYVNEYNGTHTTHEDLDDLYAVLKDVGYRMTDEERAWKDGTHPFYKSGKG